MLERTEKADVRIVFVSQGTAEVDYSQLVVPAMQALRGPDDLLTIAMLGIMGATLVDDTDVPESVRWVNSWLMIASCPMLVCVCVQCRLQIHRSCGMGPGVSDARY